MTIIRRKGKFDTLRDAGDQPVPDNDLLDCVMGRAEAPEAHLRTMVEKLRAV